MSIAATRWAHRWLAAQPMPDDGGLSCDARAALLALAGDAHYLTGIAHTSAATLGAILGRHERTVRRFLDELADLDVVPVTRVAGKSARWHFIPGQMSTPRATDARGQVVHTPGEKGGDPGRARPTKGEGYVLTSTYGSGARLPDPVIDDDLDEVPAEVLERFPALAQRIGTWQ